MDNYLALHPHMLIDIEPTLGRRERPVSKQVREIMEQVNAARDAARERAAEEAESE